MIILFIILFILLFVINIYILIKSIKTKDNKNWLILFSLNISSIISLILIVYYLYYLFPNRDLGWDFLLFSWFVVPFVFILMFIISLIFKMVEVIKNKRQNNTRKKLYSNIIRNAIILPLILVLFSTFLICIIDYSKYNLQKREKINTYNNVKREEISKMANFLNSKYNLNLQESDCIYYREQDYTRHSDIFGHGKTYNIPYLAVFKNNSENITVSDRKGFISDNKQLKELNKFIIDYYQEKTGIKFNYVEFYKSYVGSWCGDDNIINSVLQTKFNELITDNNIEEFVNYILHEQDLSITFYIDSNDNNGETLISDIINKLDYLKDYSNIDELKVYGYDGDLIIKNEKIDFSNEYKDYDTSEDYNDGYKFGCYYVDDNSINFTFSLTMDLDRGYSSGDGELINGWKYNILN